jgi:hypothetical protein
MRKVKPRIPIIIGEKDMKDQKVPLVWHTLKEVKLPGRFNEIGVKKSRAETPDGKIESISIQFRGRYINLPADCRDELIEALGAL